MCVVFCMCVCVCMDLCNQFYLSCMEKKVKFGHCRETFHLNCFLPDVRVGIVDCCHFISSGLDLT